MKFRIPHTYVLLIGLIVLAAASTWIIPAGRYDRVVEQGREVVDPLSYRPVEARPAGVGAVFLAFPRGLLEIAGIVFYIFIIGGAFGVLNRTGVIQAGVRALVRSLGGRRALIVPLLTVVFAVGGGTIGIAEETLVFLPALLLLSRSLGYDSLVGGGIALVGANAGFAAAFMNPFTVGVAQGIVGLAPLFRDGFPARPLGGDDGRDRRLSLALCPAGRGGPRHQPDARSRPGPRTPAPGGRSRAVHAPARPRSPPRRRRTRPPRRRRHPLGLGHPRALRPLLRAGPPLRPARGARGRRYGQGLRSGGVGHHLRRPDRRAGPGNARRPAGRQRHRHHHPRAGPGSPGPAAHA